jgi:hypothetical protein
MCAPIPPWKSLPVLFALVAVLVVSSLAVSAPAHAATVADGSSASASPSSSASPTVVPTASASAAPEPSATPTTTPTSPSAGAADVVVVSLEPEQWWTLSFGLAFLVFVSSVLLVAEFRK